MKDIKVKISFIITVIAIISVLIIGWKRDVKSLTPVEYVKWIQNPENGLKVEKKMQGLTFSIQYKPATFIVANNERDPHLKNSILNSQINKYSELEYYAVRISNNQSSQDLLMYNISDKNEYYQR